MASLNQYASVGGTAYGYDGNANLTSGPPQSYTFDSQNRLIGSSGGASPDYLPTDQLFQATSSGVQFLYDGDQIVAEYQSGVLQDRYVDGPDEDEPMVWYQGSGDANRQWLLNDERGSVIAGADSSGTIQFIDSYDEYGQPGGSNQGRFQYTGQAWIPEAGVYDYKARVYLASIGRFLQTDPSGFAAGMNLYAYVGNDPINGSDPTGLADPTNDPGEAIPTPAPLVCTGPGYPPGCSTLIQGVNVNSSPSCSNIFVICNTFYISSRPDFVQFTNNAPPSNGGGGGGGGGGANQPLTQAAICSMTADQATQALRQAQRQQLAQIGQDVLGALNPFGAELSLSGPGIAQDVGSQFAESRIVSSFVIKYSEKALGFGAYVGQIPISVLEALVASETAQTEALRQQIYAQDFGVDNPSCGSNAGGS